VVRGPDPIWGGDIKQFHPSPLRFDGIIGGPPCPAHSKMRHLVKAQGLKVSEDLVPEFWRCVMAARPQWFLMENVPGCPTPEVVGYQVERIELNNRSVGGVQRSRRRCVSFFLQSETFRRVCFTYDARSPPRNP